jgi:nicotinamidase-related amidase
LLVIDPVNDFLHEEGAAWEMTKSTVKKNDVVAQLARLTQGARAAERAARRVCRTSGSTPLASTSPPLR